MRQLKGRVRIRIRIRKNHTYCSRYHDASAVGTGTRTRTHLKSETLRCIWLGRRQAANSNKQLDSKWTSRLRGSDDVRESDHELRLPTPTPTVVDSGSTLSLCAFHTLRNLHRRAAAFTLARAYACMHRLPLLPGFRFST